MTTLWALAPEEKTFGSFREGNKHLLCLLFLKISRTNSDGALLNESRKASLGMFRRISCVNGEARQTFLIMKSLP